MVKNNLPKIGVFLCHCGKNISGIVDIAKLKKELEQTDPNLAVEETTPDPEPMVAASEPEQQPIETDEIEENNPPVRSSMLYILLAVIGVVFVGAVVAFILYRRKKQSEQFSLDDDINLMDEKEESEPDYKEYLKDKKKKDEEILVN